MNNSLWFAAVLSIDAFVAIALAVLIAIVCPLALWLLCMAFDRLFAKTDTCRGAIVSVNKSPGFVATPDFTSDFYPCPVTLPDMHHAIVSIAGADHLVRIDAETFAQLSSGTIVNVECAIGRFSNTIRIRRLVVEESSSTA